MIQELIRIRELEAALEANRTLLALENQKVRSVHARLISIGQELGGQQFDQFLKGHLEDEVTTEALAAEVTTLVKARLGFSNGQSEIAEWRKQAAVFEESLRNAQQRIQELEAALRASDPLTPEQDQPAASKLPQEQKDFLVFSSPAEESSPLRTDRTDPRSRLVLRTAELFTRLGYAVDRNPEKIGVDAGQGFLPDLVVSRQGEMCFLQVEIGLEDDRSALARKWDQALLVGGGRMWVVTGQLASMNTLQGQIVHWAAQNGRRCHLSLTHSGFLQSVPPGKSPWARVREV